MIKNKYLKISILSCTVLVCALNMAFAAETHAEIRDIQTVLKKGDFSEALTAAKQLVQSSSTQENTDNYLNALMLLAETYQALGQHKNAIVTLKKAMPVAETGNFKSWHLIIINSLGQSYTQTGQYKDAELWLEQAVDITSKNKTSPSEVSSLINLGNLKSQQSKNEDALKHYQKAIEICKQLDLPEQLALVLTNSARVSIALNNAKQTHDFIEQASQSVLTLKPSHKSAYLLINLSLIQNDFNLAQNNANKKWLTAPYRLLKAAEKMALDIKDDRARSYAVGHMGQLYLHENRNDEALILTRKAAFIAQQNNYTDVLYRWQWQEGRILDKQKKTMQAIHAYRQAVQSLKPVRYDIVTGYGNTNSSFRKIIGPMYFELADLLLRRSNKSLSKNKGDSQKTLLEARSIIESFKAAELEDFFQDDCVAQLKSRTSGIDAIEAGTAVIYPILLRDRIELLVSFPDGIEQFTVDITAEKIVGEIRNFRSKLEKRTTHQYIRHAQQLHKWLIEPVEQTLKQKEITTLVVVPDGALRTIPWAALHNGDEFLIERYAVAYTPGLNVTDPQPLERKNLKILLAGLSKSVQNFPSLPYVNNEIKRIHKIYDGTVLKDNDYKLESLSQQFSETPYSIVHIASHGQFRANPNQTFLLTYDDKMTMDKLKQFVGIGRFRDKPVELLTLSACQTATGDDRAALGLAGIAVKSGARSALATLWFVNDQATSLLIVDFYKNLKDSANSKALALQKAQISTLKDRRYRHPGYWAPYLLIGNWL